MAKPRKNTGAVGMRDLCLAVVLALGLTLDLSLVLLAIGRRSQTELVFGAWSGACAESELGWVETLGLEFGLRLDLGLFLSSAWA